MLQVIQRKSVLITAVTVCTGTLYVPYSGFQLPHPELAMQWPGLAPHLGAAVRVYDGSLDDNVSLTGERERERERRFEMWPPIVIKFYLGLPGSIVPTSTIWTTGRVCPPTPSWLRACSFSNTTAALHGLFGLFGLSL